MTQKWPAAEAMAACRRGVSRERQRSQHLRDLWYSSTEHRWGDPFTTHRFPYIKQRVSHLNLPFTSEQNGAMTLDTFSRTALIAAEVKSLKYGPAKHQFHLGNANSDVQPMDCRDAANFCPPTFHLFG